MGIFNRLSNKFKFSELHHQGEKFVLGVYKDKEKTKAGYYALLHGDKVLMNDITYVTDNLKANEDGQNVFLVAGDNNGYKLFTRNGELVTYENNSEYIPFAMGYYANYQGTDDKQRSFEDSDETLIIRTPNGHKTFLAFSNGRVSNFIKELGELNTATGLRKVQDDKRDYYTIDKQGIISSPKFLYESTQDGNGNRILTTDSVLGLRYVIADENYKPLSKPFPHIKRVKGHYIAENGFDETYFISPTGKRLSPSFEGDVELFASGAKLINLARDGKKTGMSMVLDQNYNPYLSGITELYLSPNHSGIAFAKVGGIPVVFGATADPIKVDYDTARLLMSIISNKKLGSLYIDKVIESGADVDSTIAAFEAVIDENLSFTPNNEILKDLKANLANKFNQKISRAAADRVRKSEKALEALRAEQERITRETEKASYKSTSAMQLRKKAKNKKPVITKESTDESENA